MEPLPTPDYELLTEEIKQFFRSIINDTLAVRGYDDEILCIYKNQKDIIVDIDISLSAAHHPNMRPRTLRFRYAYQFLRFKNSVYAPRNEILTIINSFSFDDTDHTSTEPQPIPEFIIAISGRNIIVRPSVT